MADNLWTCQRYWENPATDGPTVVVERICQKKRLWQPNTASGNGDMVSPVLPVLDINTHSITIQFDYITGNTISADKRKWYVYVGEAAGNNYSYRVKVQARSTKESLEINLFQDPPTEGGELNIKNNTRMQPNTRYRVTVTFTKNAALGQTEVRYHVANLTAGIDFIPETTGVFNAVVSNALSQFDSVKVTACGEASEIGFDNLRVTYVSLAQSEGEGEQEDEGEAEGEGEHQGEGENEGETEGEGEGEALFQLLPTSSTTTHAAIGSSVKFSVSVENAQGTVSFQWYHQRMDKAFAPVGTDHHEYVIPSVTIEDAGLYYCEATDLLTSETVTSPVFTLIVSETAVPLVSTLGFAVATAFSSFVGVFLLRKRY